MNTKLTPISELGEFGLIDRLTADIKLQHSCSVVGIGDDAAVLNFANLQTVVTTDLLVEGVHFNLTYVPLKHLGYKAVAVNISDICAMNAIPSQITVSIAVSNRFTVEALEELYQGIKLACETYKVDLIGGDTTSSISGLVISVTALGIQTPEKLSYRSGARENHLICVSGNVGAAYMGLQLLERENKIFASDPAMQPDFTGYEYILERQLKPEARLDIVQLLAELNIVPSAMIDISDGLSSELLHICKRSGTGCLIYENKIPIDEQTASMAKEFELDPLVAAMNGGEDYELLFTVPVSYFEQIKAKPQISIIGRITTAAEGANLSMRDGTIIPFDAQGWNALN